MRQFLVIFLLAAAAQTLFAQSAASLLPVRPAILELILPPGVTATVNGQEAAAKREFEFSQFDTNGHQRVEVVGKMADSTEIRRSVDLQPGQRIHVPLNMLPVDRPTTISTDSPRPVLWAAFSPDSRWLATASENRAVILWNLAVGRVHRSFSGHQDAVQSVAFSPSSDLLLTASGDGTAILWNITSGRIVRKLTGHSAGVNSAVFSRDGTRILTGSSDNTAILWNADTGAQLRIFKGHTNEILGATLSPDGRTVATASTDRFAILWNADTGDRLFTMRTRDTVSGIVFSDDGSLVAASNYENDAYVWETSTGKTLGVTRRGNLDFNSISFLPGSRYFFTAGKDAVARMWETSTRLQVREFTGHSIDLQSVAASPDGRLLLTSSRDGTARIWDIATGAELVCLASDASGESWVVVTPDGLFDASEQGRKMMGYRFSSKLPGAVIDQFFGRFYHPGLLAEIMHGGRPMSATQLGTSLPPKLKIVAPTVHSTTNEQVQFTVDAMDQGGGIAALTVFNNGARIRVQPSASQEGNITHYSFQLPLARGANQVRVTASCTDGSWESIPTEFELHSSRHLDRKSRMFVIAVGTDDSPSHSSIKDARALANLFQRQSAKLYDRVDNIPLLGKAATRAAIKNALMDVAGLSRPQDTVLLLLCGRGMITGDHFYFAPFDVPATGVTKDISQQPLMDGNELAALLGGANALNRVMIVDTSNVGMESLVEKPAHFGLRRAVERWSRSQGIYVMAACTGVLKPTVGGSHSLLTGLLLDIAAGLATATAGSDSSNGSLAVNEYFSMASKRAGPLMERLQLPAQELEQSTKSKGFPLLTLEKQNPK